MCEVSETLTRKTNRSKSTLDLAPIKEGFLVKKVFIKGQTLVNWNTIRRTKFSFPSLY